MAARKKTTRKTKPATRGAAAAKKGATGRGAPKGKPPVRKSKSSRSRSKSADPDDPRQRLQRVMASAGVASRRECETIILEGRVEVDGKVVMTLGTKVDPAKQSIYVDGDELRQERPEYYILNKPQGIVSTSNDPSGRPRVIDLIKTRSRVYNVGRLDQSSEGLILVTNDGELANRLTHPRYGIVKTYHVQVAGQPTAQELRVLVDGVYLAEGKAKATSAKFLRRAKENSWIEMELTEGRNREIRRLLAKIGHKVRRLKRVAIGSLRLGELPTGAHRKLTQGELRSLKKIAFGKIPVRKKKPVGTKRKARGLDEVQAEIAEAKEAARAKPGRKKSSRAEAAAKSSGSVKRVSVSKSRATKKKPASRGAAAKAPGKKVAGRKVAGGRGRAKPVTTAKRKSRNSNRRRSKS